MQRTRRIAEIRTGLRVLRVEKKTCFRPQNPLESGASFILSEKQFTFRLKKCKPINEGCRIRDVVWSRSPSIRPKIFQKETRFQPSGLGGQGYTAPYQKPGFFTPLFSQKKYVCNKKKLCTGQKKWMGKETRLFLTVWKSARLGKKPGFLPPTIFCPVHRKKRTSSFYQHISHGNAIFHFSLPRFM